MRTVVWLGYRWIDPFVLCLVIAIGHATAQFSFAVMVVVSRLYCSFAKTFAYLNIQFFLLENCEVPQKHLVTVRPRRSNTFAKMT